MEEYECGYSGPVQNTFFSAFYNRKEERLFVIDGNSGGGGMMSGMTVFVTEAMKGGEGVKGGVFVAFPCTGPAPRITLLDPRAKGKGDVPRSLSRVPRAVAPDPDPSLIALRVSIRPA